jgi:Domain of unknown function (DUF4407)
MLNPAYIPFAFLGGRSWGEIKACTDARSMDGSILIGVASAVSTVIIFGGQWLFWLSIPSTAAWAPLIAGVLTLVYVLFYRTIIRASEVVRAKWLLFLMAFWMAGVNALLVGHELVLLPFAPQVQAMTLELGDDSVNQLRSKAASSLGLEGLRSDLKLARDAESDARERLNTVPPAIEQQQAQAKTCDQQAARMRANLPDPENPGYETALQNWRVKRSQCGQLNKAARDALNQHQQQAAADLQIATAQVQTTNTRFDKAQNQIDGTVTTAQPVLSASASTGFGRHEALWAAVNKGTIPGWAAYGLMSIVLILELLGVLLKLVLPTDEAAAARAEHALSTATMARCEQAFTRAFAAQIQPAIRAQNGNIQTDAERLVRQQLAPSLMTRFTATLFERASRRTRQAQQNTQDPATPVIDELSKVMPTPDMARGTA